MSRQTALSTPTYIKFYPTLRCTNNCIFCFLGDDLTKHSSYKEMNKNQLNKFLGIVKKLKIFRFAILGGEPFLYKNLDILIKGLHKLKVYTTIATNGTVLDKKIIGLIKKYNVNLGVSLQSYKPEVHNGLVNSKNAFEKVMKFIDYLNKIDYKFRISPVVCNENSKDIKKFIEFAAGKKAYSLEFIYPLPTGNMRKNKLGGISLKKYISLIKKAKKIGKGYNFNVGADCHYSFLIEKQKYSLDNPLAPLLYGCSAAKTKLDVLPNGEIYPCSFFMHEKKWLIGNILKNNIIKLWKDSEILRQFRNRKFSKRCNRCGFFQICQGGCPGAHYLEYSSLNCTKLNCPPDPNCKIFCIKK